MIKIKKSLYRLKRYIEKCEPNKIYIISKDQIATSCYIKYISQQLNINPKSLCMIRKKYLSEISEENCVLLLCGIWYKNIMIRDPLLWNAINSKYTIPIDEIE